MRFMDWLLGPAEDAYEDDHEDERGDEQPAYQGMPDIGGNLAECPYPQLNCGCPSCAERWRVAIHEAGHVVALNVLGLDWEHAEIEEDPTGRTHSFGGGVETASTLDDIHGDDIYLSMIVYHAGHAAELAVFGGLLVQSVGDLDVAERLAARWGATDGTAEAMDDAAELVAANADELNDLAEELFTEGRIYP